MRTKTEDITRYMPTGETYTVDLFEYHELSDDAQKRIIDEYTNERANDPYFGQWFSDTYEYDIWDCVRDLEKSITGARVKWFYNRWYSADFDCEYSYDDCYDPGYIGPVKYTGYYASMDICDAWSKHARKLNGLYYQFEYLDYLCWSVYNDWGYHYKRIRENETFFNRADRLRDRVVTLWYEELEKACDDVRNTIETLLRSEWEYYTSDECARDEFEANETGYECRTIDNAGRVYYFDSRKWYTSDGELYEQSNVNHKCISIVKSSHYE